MAGLALIVSLMFLSVLLIGPLTYLLSLFSWIPKIVIRIFSLICLFVGAYALFIPVPLFRILGLVDIVVAWQVIFAKPKKETNA
jgi:hypothetical protein